MLEVTSEDYCRAEKFLSPARKLTFNTRVQPNWIDDGNRFWYRRDSRRGKEFVLVDPELKLVRPAFDHVRLAASLSVSPGKVYQSNALPFDSFTFSKDERFLQFSISSTKWKCDLQTYQCDSINDQQVSEDERRSPDGRWAAFVKDDNVHIRSLITGDKIQLTTAGRPYYNYGTSPESNTSAVTDRLSIENPFRYGMREPVVIWSPDSKRLVTHRLDQRDVAELYLVMSPPPSAKSSRPLLHSYRYPLVGDENISWADLIILDVARQSTVVASCRRAPVTFLTPIEFKLVWWGEDSEHVYFIHRERGERTLVLYEVNATTGMARILVEEKGETQIEPGPVFLPYFKMDNKPNVRILKNGKEVVWFSERDGWAHLYLYDGENATLKRPITSGKWVVREVFYLDEVNRLLYFTAGGREEGRDPYYRHLYRIGIDDGIETLELLTPEDADHDIRFSPTGRYFVDTYSRVDLLPVSVLRAADGTLVRILEEADLSLLIATGWKWPERFKVKARDGVTDIYGVIYRPSNFDPSKKYPIIDDIYPGPQMIRTAKSFDPDPDYQIWFWHPQAIAELGFIVVTLDGIGTPFRSKAFHDFSYGKLDDAGGLEDHVAAIRQLAERYPDMDLNRVGIYGHSGGGYASTRAILSYPDFFKVAVSSAGNHDQRGYLANWGEKYHGLIGLGNYERQANATLARNLKGKLLLVFGDMDDNVHPALTLQLVDALIAENKDFDLIILPNRNHGFFAEPYFIRRRWDYFVRHLLGVEPPKDYVIRSQNLPSPSQCNG